MVSSTLREASEGGNKKGQFLSHKNGSPDSTNEKSVEPVAEMSTDSDSSEDDVVVVPDYVDAFYIRDNTDNDNLVSILELPFSSRMFSSESSTAKEFYLFGKCDNGLQPVMHPINSWKLEFGREPEFSVRTLQGNWIRLGKPFKSYEAGEFRTALVVAHFLNFLKMNTDASEAVVWTYLRKMCCTAEMEPSSNDLVQHSAIIKKLVKDNPILEKAQIIGEILKKRKGADDFIASKKQKRQDTEDFTFGLDDPTSMNKVEKLETRRNTEKFISQSDDSEFESDGELDDSDDEEVGENVCAICDDGGDIMCCDGPCLRSFHATKAAAAKSESGCVSLGFAIQEVKEMGKFYCWNCQYKQHQCFVCGQLGSSDEPSKEVFVCDVALCGRFYHPVCAAEILVIKEEQATFIARIRTGVEAFSCPLHKCMKCKKGDMTGSEETRLYSCRRCPRAWHKQCISDKIRFYSEEDEPGIRGWEMDGTRFLYCLRHEIDEDLGTPVRDHLIFPNGHKLGGSRDLSLKKERKVTVAGTSLLPVERARPIKRLSDTTPPTKKSESRVSSKDLDKPIFKKPPAVPTLHALVAKKKSLIGTSDLTPIKAKRAPAYNEDEIKEMLESFVELSKKTITSDTVSAKLMIPFIYKEHTTTVKKSISLGKLESVLHALSKARACLISGGIEEAECIFPEESIRVLERSKNKLRVYLAPILYGMRYTSFGRHFTKINKLKEVVNRLHWYVNSGDMVVDFCCGANDFSRLMFEKLEQSGKKCDYKNFDIIQPKHDFNFIKKDWLKVERRELPSGDRLIMGLNPPFGVKAQLANTMVDHVLTFKPKIIILIVPKETRRLESNGYECIWEDPFLLSGQAFYFPGSVDINDKVLSQENLDAPPLYMWSRTNWADRHHKIAAAHGHLNENFHDLSLQQIEEPTSVVPLAITAEMMYENNELRVERKEQQAAVKDFASSNERHDAGKGSTTLETVPETNQRSVERTGLKNLDKAKAPDAGNRLGKLSSKKKRLLSPKKSVLEDSATPFRGKDRDAVESKQDSKFRRHSGSSHAKSEQVSKSESSRRQNPSLRERERHKDRSEAMDHRKAPERMRLNRKRGFDSREPLRTSKFSKKRNRARDADRTFPSGRHGSSPQERFLTYDGRKSGHDRRTYEDRRRYEDRIREEDRESLRHTEENKAEGSRSLSHLGLNSELHESSHHQKSPVSPERLESIRGYNNPSETASMTHTVDENLHRTIDERRDGSKVYEDEQVEFWRKYHSRQGLEEGSEGKRSFMEDLRLREEDRRGYLEEKQRLDASRGLLHSAGVMDVLSPEMLARGSSLQHFNPTLPAQQRDDFVHIKNALLEHQRQPFLRQLQVGGLPFDAQRNHPPLTHSLLELEMKREMLRRHGSGLEQTSLSLDANRNISGQSQFGPGTPGEASGPITSLLRREVMPIRESSLLGQGNVALRANLGLGHLHGESLGRLTPFRHDNAALRGLLLSDNERRHLSLSGHNSSLDPRGLPPDLLLRNQSLGAPMFSQLQERLDPSSRAMYRNEFYPGKK